jgi:photosystem II stability/assembly factor-like uncharacterized protein/uncharacterized protein YmfQ (DUF2313 family)
MAFVDLDNTVKLLEAYDSETAEIDVVHFKYTRVMQDLLPPGKAFTRRTAAVLTKLLAGLGMEFSRIQRGIYQMLQEAKPSTAYQTLGLWETLLGLPDCEEPTTLEGRRQVAAAKLAAAAGHTQEPGWWEGLFEGLGYELVDFFNFGGYVGDCADDCLDGIFPSEWQFVVWLLANHGDADELLECQVDAEQLLGMELQMHWMWDAVEVADPDPPVDLRGVATSQHGWTVAVTSAGGVVLRAKEFLSSWTAIDPGDPMPLYAIADAGGNRLYAVGDPGGALISSDGGATWSKETFASGELYAISRVDTDETDAIAVGEDGRIFKATADGGTWTEKTSPTSEYLYGVTRCQGAMVAVGDNGTIIRSTDQGENWSAVVSGTPDDLYAVSGWGLDVVAVGVDGTMVYSDDAGATWTALSNPTNQTLRGVVAAPTGRWTACGASGTVLQATEPGGPWTLQTTETTVTLWAAAFSALLGQAVLVGDDNTILRE